MQLRILVRSCRRFELVKEKQKLTLSVDKEVVEKAKKLGINISEITEKVLTGYTSAEKPEGSIHDAYKQLFDSILPLLKEFDCKVKIAESWMDINEFQQEIEDETYLTQYNTFLIRGCMGQEDYYISDIKRLPPGDFLPPEKILSNLVNELAKNQEKRKERMDEISMAKRIIDAMSETLLKKQPTTET
jgi:hypothetical protein